jgi:hypothetical protein
MKYLLYGIYEPCPEGAFLEPGICAVEAHGLAAAASLIEETDSAPSVASLLDYERVIEAMHARQAVIPLRYGCLMESESAIVRLLENHSQEYRRLLGRLGGATEMGVRVLCQARPGVLPASPSSPGSRYLALLRSRYVPGSSLAPEEAELADQIAGRLAGLYTEQQREVVLSGRGRLVSLYYLTPKTAVERFRNIALAIRPPSGEKLLLSGPWPPYNFVVSPA